MKFTDKDIEMLSASVASRLTQKRYIHTLGTLSAAVKIAEHFEFCDISEIKVAALLHDISKEYSEAEQLELAKNGNISLSADDVATSAALHSLTAPYVIQRDFAQFATANVLSAVYNHTLGHENMSLFDEIIFISDYIEDGRTYESCVEVRDMLYRELSSAEESVSTEKALHRAVYYALRHTINSLTERGRFVHPRTSVTFAKYEDKIK